MEWLTQLVKEAAKQPNGLNKTVFELQSVDWKTQKKIAMPIFINQLKLLQKLGVNHIGYYPDNVFEDQPRLSNLQQYFSIPALP